MSRHVSSIANRLSLRAPQRESLQRLHRLMELAQPRKGTDPASALAALRAEFPDVADFERAFPSVCFSLATGVGKTRLMGAFIAYLHLEHGIRHFFVLAPNLTIYQKLVADFTPNTPKYVFQGIAELAVKAPALVTGDNFEQRPQVLELFERDDVVVNIFNIAKFNVRAADSRKIRRLSEYLGQSYFDYLAGLDDLVLLMDEAHRYRADTSMQSIEELKPVLGLELTATPQVESGSKPTRFKNVLFDYPLASAMRDGFVKEPAVATRADFNPASMSAAELERLKLEDGIRIHESVKVDLEVYAQQNSVRKVKPFMLVIASDTEHATALVRLMEAPTFFEGRYQGRVIQVHSGQKGAEKDENIERLLAVERADEPTEVVVHVNMLKEGWDVTNLYTIVPLRAADSRTLVEQSIGRGLRLPYGQRTGTPAVDRLTIVAHDRFQEIVDHAKSRGYSFSTVHIGVDVSETPKRAVSVSPRIESILGIGAVPTDSGAQSTAASPAGPPPPAPLYTTPEQLALAQATYEAIGKVARDPKLVPTTQALMSRAAQEKILGIVSTQVGKGQISMYTAGALEGAAAVIRDVSAAYVKHTIGIPRIVVLPKGTVRAGYRSFTLDLASFRWPTVAQEILVQDLTTGARAVIGALVGGLHENRLEDYVVRGLMDYDDVSYDEHGDLLYALAGQVVAHLRGYLKDDDEVRNVLLFHQRQLAELVHTQMMPHAWEEASHYEAHVSQGMTAIQPQMYSAPTNEAVRRFDLPVERKVDIRQMLFGGFQRCLYPTQKFDSDAERRFSVVLEREALAWFKPGRADLRIGYNTQRDYQPDFVAETAAEKLLCEVKAEDEMLDPLVLAKARAAVTWCQHASAHERSHEGKPWRYLLIPHNVIGDNSTLAGLTKSYERVEPPESA